MANIYRAGGSGKGRSGGNPSIKAQVDAHRATKGDRATRLKGLAAKAQANSDRTLMKVEGANKKAQSASKAAKFAERNREPNAGKLRAKAETLKTKHLDMYAQSRGTNRAYTLKLAAAGVKSEAGLRRVAAARTNADARRLSGRA